MDIKFSCIYQAGLKFFEENPKIYDVERCFYLPRTSHSPDATQSGIYDKYGRLIPACNVSQGWPSRASQAPHCPISPSSAFPEAPEEIYFYGGQIHKHFGHFITSVLPRFWCGKQQYKGLKILIHAMEELEYLFSIPWFVEFFHFLDLGKDDFVLFKHPTWIKRLRITEPAFEEEHFSHRIFALFCNKIGREHKQTYPRDGKIIYLTRSHYQDAARHIENEDILTDILIQKGFHVVSPEQLSVSEQLGLFSSEYPTIGFLGSAFHNSIFTSSPVGLALSCEWSYHSNYFLTDKANEARIAYVQAPYIDILPHDDIHDKQYKITDPSALAEHIQELVNAKVWNYQAPSPPLYNIPASTQFEGQQFYIKTCHNTYLMAQTNTGMIHHKPEGENDFIKIMGQFIENDLIKIFVNEKYILSMPFDMLQGAEKYYKLPGPKPENVLHNYHTALITLDTGRLLTALPNGTLEGNRSHLQEWETFFFEII